MASSTLSCLRRCSRSSLAAAQYTRRVTSSTTAFPTSLLSSTARPVSIACTIRPFSSSTTRKMGYDSIPLLQAIENRRSIYALTKKAPQSDARIREIVEAAVKHTPSTFNSQSSRLVVLLNEEHDKFWDTVIEILKAIVPADSWEHTGKRMDMFRGGYGTILFYEDPEPTKALQSKMPQYADKFPQWSEHTSAMHQYVLWTALESEGFGCNLQHYNPLPDQKVSEIWKIPLEWSLKAQLVFGGLADGARENLQTKTFQPLENRLFVHGAKQ